MKKRKRFLMGLISLSLITAAAALFSGCEVPKTDLFGMVLVSANESLSTRNITGPGFANGAGPWTLPSEGRGTFLELGAANSTASSVELVIRVGSTGSSDDGVVFRVALGAGSELYTTVLCRFNEPYPASFKAWHDGADLTGVTLTSIPLYWLVDQVGSF